MKIIEVTAQLRVAITNEEADILSRFDESTPVLARRDLNEREKVLANQLVNKSILSRRKDEQGRINYKRRIRQGSS